MKDAADYTALYGFKKKDVGKYPLYFKDYTANGNIFIDTSNGPIIIEEGSEIESFSILRGPLWLKEKSKILSAKVSGPVVIGKVSKVGSEIDFSVLDDYSNMAHTGFLGHSYVGRWVNVGAGTVFSDLKNTYGVVKMSVNGVVTSSGKIKLGSFVSDYSKIAIGTMIYSGKWIGISSHVYNIVDRDIPSFTIWRNGLFEEMNIEKAIEIQARMFSRRDIIQKSYHKNLLKHLFNMTRENRRKLAGDNTL
jgi:glucose-1-phosphate thymidylyltransferase